MKTKKQKKAIQSWKEKMRNLYPDFTTSKWAKSQYRINHPQPLG